MELKAAFLARYFPSRKIAQVRGEINNFIQEDCESLFDVWEGFKYLLRLCFFHGLDKWIVIHIFYNGLLYSTRMNLDVVAGGALMNNPQDMACTLIEDMAKSQHSSGNSRERSDKAPQKGGLYEVSQFDHIT